VNLTIQASKIWNVYLSHLKDRAFRRKLIIDVTISSPKSYQSQIRCVDFSELIVFEINIIASVDTYLSKRDVSFNAVWKTLVYVINLFAISSEPTTKLLIGHNDEVTIFLSSLFIKS